MEQGWGGMKTHPPSLLSPSREFKWMGRDAQVPFIPSPTDPQCEQCGTMYGHNATIVNSHCRLPLCRTPPSQRAMATLPVDSDFVVSSLPSTFGAASDLDWEGGGKLRPIKWEIVRRIWFLESHSPLLVVAMVPRRRCSPGVISQLSGQAWPNLPLWLAARAALTHPTTLPTFITIALPIFISWYILFSISIIRESLSSIWSIACVDYQ